MTIVPAPVIVRVEPFTVPGPEMTEKVTANPELAEARSVMGLVPRVTPEIGPKVIVWPSFTTIVVDPVLDPKVGVWPP